MQTRATASRHELETARRRAAKALAQATGAIVRRAVELCVARFQRPAASRRERCANVIRRHLAYLAQAVAVESPVIFVRYAEWCVQVRAVDGDATGDLATDFECLQVAIRAHLPESAARPPVSVVEAALDALETASLEPESFLETSPRPALARRYLEALLDGDRRGASQLVRDARHTGASLTDVYRGVFEPAMYEVGRLWQANRISVAQEHFCSAATQWAMAQLHSDFPAPETCAKRLVATCVSGERHEIGLQMVTDCLELAGWKTTYLGANTPSEAVIEEVRRQRADLLAISATMATRVCAVEELTRLLRRDSDMDSVKVMVGGTPFETTDDLYAKVGADAFARSCDEAVHVASNLSS